MAITHVNSGMRVLLPSPLTTYNITNITNMYLVSDVNEHCIKVFAGNGNFLYKFGNKGEGNGEFINLCHLSVNKGDTWWFMRLQTTEFWYLS